MLGSANPWPICWCIRPHGHHASRRRRLFSVAGRYHMYLPHAPFSTRMNAFDQGCDSCYRRKSLETCLYCFTGRRAAATARRNTQHKLYLRRYCQRNNYLDCLLRARAGCANAISFQQGTTKLGIYVPAQQNFKLRRKPTSLLDMPNLCGRQLLRSMVMLWYGSKRAIFIHRVSNLSPIR